MFRFIELFTLGITMAFGPCLFFCTPVVLSYIASTQDSGQRGFKSVLIFSFSRAFIYILLGLLAGLFGQLFITELDKYRQIIYLTGGIFISFTGIFILMGHKPSLPLCGILKNHTIEQNTGSLILLGIIMGLLPCAPLLGVLAYISLVSNHFWQGALLGLSFGMGTILSPLILLGIVVSSFSKKIIKHPNAFEIFKKICGFLLFLFGIQLIISGKVI